MSQPIAGEPVDRDPRRRRRCASFAAAGGRRGLQGQLRPVPRHRAPRARRAIPTSTTTTGSGAARPTRSRRPSRTASASRTTPTRAFPRCRPSATSSSRRRSSEVAAYVAVAVGQRRRYGGSSATGADVFADELRRLPRRDRQGQPRARRAGPDRRDLALRHRPKPTSSRQIRAPRHGVMPAWAGRLGDTTVKELAVYVHSLGGGE